MSDSTDLLEAKDQDQQATPSNWLDTLTVEQRQVVETWDQGVAVMAGAGSGKTHTLRAKVRFLLESRPEARFAAVSFTEKSANDLHQKLTELTLEILGRPLMGHVVTTIHGLCSSILREFPIEAGFDGDERMLNEAEAFSLWQQTLDQLWFDDLPMEISEAFSKALEALDRVRLNQVLTRLKSLESLVPDESLGRPEISILFRYCLERYDRLKRRRGALDFDDLEKGADRALSVPEVSRELQDRFDLVMVDEFQDTNPVQARILRRIAKPGLRNLVVVGDPKQSIYRFRDADVSVFDAFCTELPVRVKLTRNFRSRQGILEFCNEVCEPLFTASGLQYDALQPNKPPHESLPPVLGVQVSDPEGFAAWLKDACQSGMDLADTALLLRKVRGGSEKWIRALMQAGVPVAIESGGLLWKDPRPRELVLLLKWWSNPLNEVSGAAFLRSPWVGVSDPELDEWHARDPSFVTPFFESELPVAQALRILWIRREAVRPGEVLSQLLHVRELDEEMGASILGLWHRAEELSLGGLSFKEVVAHLSEAMTDERREKDVPPPRNQGQLRVLTIHGSKGLEFRHVILLDFPEKKLKAPNMPLLFWNRDEGAWLPPRDEDDEVIEDPRFEAWKSRELAESLAETKRVFYVALTRAEDQLVLILPTRPAEPEKAVATTTKKPKKAKEPENPLVVDHWREWVRPALVSLKIQDFQGRTFSDRDRQSARHEAHPLPAERPSFLRRRPRHSVSEWNLLSKCPRQFQWKTIERLKPEDEPEWIGHEESSKPKKKVAQSEVGTRVHQCLEQMDETGLRSLEKELGSQVFKADALIKWMKSSPWMQSRSGRTIWKEFAFEIPIEDEALVGAMDRLVLDEGPEGIRFTLIDFKVTSRWKEPQALLEEYATQLNLYAWALFQMEPRASVSTTRAFLIQISGDRVEEVEVPLRESELVNFKALASRIVQGHLGETRPGKICRHCDFRSSCDASPKT